MKNKIIGLLLCAVLMFSPRSAKADLFGGDGVPRNARV